MDWTKIFLNYRAKAMHLLLQKGLFLGGGEGEGRWIGFISKKLPGG